MSIDVSNRKIDIANNSTNVRLYPKSHSLYFEDYRYLPGGISPYQINAASMIPGKAEGGNILDLTYEQRKGYFVLQDSVYHFFMDCVGAILDYVDSFPESELILDTTIIKRAINIPHNHFFNFFFDALVDHGVKLTVIDSSQYDAINFKNFSVIQFAEANPIAPERIFNFFKKYVKNPDQEPYRNVYLGRKKMGKRVLSPDRQVFGVLNDDRIDDHDDIEKLFKDLGFEIVYPEDFRSFEEQINLFYSTKTLASLTSSGLVNACLMRPNQTMIEIVTPLIFDMMQTPMYAPGDPPVKVIVEQLHHYYQSVAFFKNHNYIGIQNWDRSTDIIRESVNREPYIKNFFDRVSEVKKGIFGWKK